MPLFGKIAGQLACWPSLESAVAMANRRESAKELSAQTLEIYRIGFKFRFLPVTSSVTLGKLLYKTPDSPSG